jgi:DNA topoisomerase-1
MVHAEMEQYTLVITEKPDAAERIAHALDTYGRARKLQNNGVPYYLAKREKELVVVPALGHLYTVAAEENAKRGYPVFNYTWLPRHAVEKRAASMRKWIESIEKLANNADTFIDACDYDIEGSLIGYCILKYACKNKETISKRMKYSTLTKEELEKSYEEALPHLDFGLIEAGRTRHEIDWLYGINLSRALTSAAKKRNGKYVTLSTGRVQGPTLAFVVAREKTIQSFVPTPYWSIKAEVEIDGRIFEAEYEKKIIKSKKEADAIVEACKGKDGKIENVDTKEFEQPPPPPFDLGALQSEAYSLFGYTPMRTSNIAQRLYLDALISYPRTSSQKLPPTINYRMILTNLSRNSAYRGLAEELLTEKELKPKEGKKEDSAHPAIYPTGTMPERSLDASERNLLDLVVRRFMAVFADAVVKQSIKVCINVDGQRFYLNGRRTLKEGWLRFYKPYVRTEETMLPPVHEGQKANIKKVILEDRFTKPPPRYNQGSLLERMEKTEIGTKATRAGIIETLYDRKYIHNDRIETTNLGFEVLEILKKYCPPVVSVKLSRELEEKMNRIQTKSEKRETVLNETVQILEPVLKELKEKEQAIGEKLNSAIRRAPFEDREIGVCPICKSGRLIIVYSRKTGKRFIGCTNYFKGTCKTAFPLPQKGTVKPLGKNCRGCGWPTLQVYVRGRRPWRLCFNPKCPLKEARR